MVAGRLLQRDSGADVAMGEAIRDDFAGMTRAGALLTRSALGVATLLLALVFVVINPRFATWPNLVALVEQNATLAIIAVGAMIGIVSRSVDISPGSVIALGAVVAALAGQAGVPCAACAASPASPPASPSTRLNGLIVGRPRPRSADRHARRLDLGARPRRLADRRHDDRPSTWASSR